MGSPTRRYPVEPHPRRASCGRIHASHGYTLRVPAGALAREEKITVTPIARFSGMPFFGGRVAGADLAPDGLRFSSPATLEIKPKRRFPSHTAGFTFSGGSAGFDMSTPRASRGVLRLRIDHFTTGGASTFAEADFANVAGPLVNAAGPLSLSQIRQLIDLMGVFAEEFDSPGDPFCQRQPICDQVRRKALDSLATMIDQQCALAAANHDITRLATVFDLEGLRVSLGAEDVLSHDCQGRILSNAIALAVVAARADPYSVNATASDLPAARIDLDGDGVITNVEWLVGLAFHTEAIGFGDISAAAFGEVRALLADLPARGRSRCESDRSGGEADLVRGLAYANEIDAAASLGRPLIEQFFEALDFCRIEVQATPAQVTLIPGAQQQFIAAVVGLIDPPANGDVLWSATGGSITPAGGLYTAPDTAGTFEVRATSTTNSSRFGVATVNVEGCPTG